MFWFLATCVVAVGVACYFDAFHGVVIGAALYAFSPDSKE